MRLFWDKSGGGFFFTALDAEKLLVRQKEIYDGAIPSGNSVAALDLIRVGRLTMEKEFAEKAESLFKIFSNEISQMPNAYPQMLIALDFALGPSKGIVIAEGKDKEKSLAIVKTIYEKFIPNKVAVLSSIGEKEQEGITELIPFIKNQVALEDKTTVYVCTNYICKFPTASISKMKELLN